MISGGFLIIGIQDGESVEYTELITAPSTISVSPFNVQRTPLSIELVHRAGTSTTPQEGFIQVRAKSGDVAIAGTEHSLGMCSKTSYTIAANNMKLAAATSIVVEAFNNVQKEVLLASFEVPINVYGNADAVYRDFKWSDTPVWTDLPVGTTFRNGDYFVIEKNGQSNIYMWVCRVAGITTKAPFDPTISPEEAGCWQHVTEKTLFATKMLLAKSALLGSAVFNGDWTISQHGVSMGTNPDTGQPYDFHDFEYISDLPEGSSLLKHFPKFKPTLAINWLLGKVFGYDINIQKGRIGDLFIEGNTIYNKCIDRNNNGLYFDIREEQTGSILKGLRLAHNGTLIDSSVTLDKSYVGRTTGIRFLGQGDGITGLYVRVNQPEKNNSSKPSWAMNVFGSCMFYQRDGDIWHAPGVLYAGHFGADGTKHYEWGQGAGNVTCKPEGVGNYRIFHELNMKDYFVHITPYTTWAFATPQSKENKTFWFTITEGGHLKSLEFDVIIYGRPVAKDYSTGVV